MIGATRWSQQTVWIPALFFDAGTASSRTMRVPLMMRSASSRAGVLTLNAITASVGGFSPMKV